MTEGQLADLSRLKGVKIEQVQRPAYVVLYLDNRTRPLYFGDARVRRALSMAIDRKAITDKVFLGAATPSSSPIAPGSWAYAADYDATAPDLDSARALLAEAGWTPHPTSGILINSGQEFRFTIRTDNDPARVAVAEEIARQLGAARHSRHGRQHHLLRPAARLSSGAPLDAAVAGWTGTDLTPTSAGTAPSRAPPASTSPTSGMWSWTN